MDNKLKEFIEVFKNSKYFSETEEYINGKPLKPICLYAYKDFLVFYLITEEKELVEVQCNKNSFVINSVNTIELPINRTYTFFCMENPKSINYHNLIDYCLNDFSPKMDFNMVKEENDNSILDSTLCKSYFR